VSDYTHGPRSVLMAKDVVAGMSIFDPDPHQLCVPRTVLVVSTEYKETTRLIQGPNDRQGLDERSTFEMLLMDDPEKWQCHVCRVSPGTLVNLAAPKFVLPPSPRKAEEP